jgi:co-chaperonin GroES (HSP10)
MDAGISVPKTVQEGEDMGADAAEKVPTRVDLDIPTKRDLEKGNVEDINAAKQMPEPTGYHILVTLPQVEKVTDGGVHLPDQHLTNETTASVVGFVVAMGPDCYRDEKRFPSGAWCKEGDFVLFRPYQGSRFKVHGVEFRVINDDSIEGVVGDPRGYTRA